MIRPKEPSDSELLRRMGAGDQEAFRTIYQQCQGPIYRFALHMTGNTFLAEDVTQEVFMTLIQERARFEPSRGTLSAYLFGMGRNLLLRRLDREQRPVEKLLRPPFRCQSYLCRRLLCSQLGADPERVLQRQPLRYSSGRLHGLDHLDWGLDSRLRTGPGI